MSRKERFLEAIDKAEKEASRKRLEGLSIEKWWNEIREAVIRPVLVDAAAALREAGYNADQMNKNGEGIILRAGSPSCSLEFVRIDEHIRVTFSDSNLTPEIWDDRNHVTDENIESKVNLLIELIVTGEKQKKGLTWGPNRSIL
jgi:hypothetical protein